MRPASIYPTECRNGAAKRIAVAISLLATCAAGVRQPWAPLNADGIHDPTSPVCMILQEPQQALRALPRNPVGNKVDWVEALKRNLIQPRAGLADGARMQVLDMDLVMKRTATMPHVRFSHLVHTGWLDCRNCHDRLFAAARRAAPMTMVDMLRGELCGRCHGTIAFPLSDCIRCHSLALEEPDTVNR